MHVEFLVEEQSAVELLKVLVPKVVGPRITFNTHPFAGKLDLLNKLPSRLEGYKAWMPSDWRIAVLTDKDNDDCRKLKARLERFASDAGLATRSKVPGKVRWLVLNRLAIEELEAWFLGDVEALTQAYPRVPPTLGRKRGYRDPDSIMGGTWEALERVLQRAGYYSAGMPKVEVARRVAAHMIPDRNRSHSFKVFCEGLRELVR